MRLPVLTLILCLAAGGSASAQSELELFAGFYNADADLRDSNFDKGGIFGIRGGRTFLKFFAAELNYTFVSDIQEQAHGFDGSAHLLNTNVLLQVPVDQVVPFATVGVGTLFGRGDGFLDLQNSFTWNAGGGLKLRNLLGPFGVRVDVRFYKVSDGFEIPGDPREADFDFSEVSAGLLLTL